MAWKWYEITGYKASVGGEKGDYYGAVQLFGEGFYGLLKFYKKSTLPLATAPTTYGQRFYGHMDYQQMQVMVDLLRNEKPIRFGWYKSNPNLFQLMTGVEDVGEGDGILAESAELVA
ncbi:MAG: hypothetical protein ACI8P3_001684 [Saprospiraceae bacterium]|jgi:hypothetical protein